MTALVAVLVPVLGRPHRVAPLLESFRSTTMPEDAELYFVVNPTDVQQMFVVLASGQPYFACDEVPWSQKINVGYRSTLEPWMLLGADDLLFHQGWIDAVRADLLGSEYGVVGTNDLTNIETMKGNTSTHPLVRRSYADLCGTVDEKLMVVHGGYKHNYPDAELCLTAIARKSWVHRATCYVEHMHHLWGKSPFDATYAYGQSFNEQDKKLFESRLPLIRAAMPCVFLSVYTSSPGSLGRRCLSSIWLLLLFDVGTLFTCRLLRLVARSLTEHCCEGYVLFRLHSFLGLISGLMTYCIFSSRIQRARSYPGFLRCRPLPRFIPDGTVRLLFFIRRSDPTTVFDLRLFEPHWRPACQQVLFVFSTTGSIVLGLFHSDR